MACIGNKYRRGSSATSKKEQVGSKQQGTKDNKNKTNCKYLYENFYICMYVYIDFLVGVKGREIKFV